MRFRNLFYLEGVCLDLKVATCVQEIESMGFDNCNGWITKLSILMDGDVSRVIEALPQDEKYAEILEIEQ